MYNQEQICNLVGADSRTRFSLQKMYKNSEPIDFWIGVMKDFNPNYVDSLKKLRKVD